MKTNSSFPKNAGFTLIEVLIVCAIIAILAAVALPSYQDSVRKTKRAEGKAALLQVMQQQERFYSQNTTYAAFTAAASAGFKTYSGESGAGKANYQITGAACGGVTTLADCVILTATPSTGSHVFVDTQCQTLTLTNLGVRGVTGGATMSAIDCWK